MRVITAGGRKKPGGEKPGGLFGIGDEEKYYEEDIMFICNDISLDAS